MAIKDFISHVKQASNVSGKEHESKSYQNATTKEETTKLLITAIKNIKPNVEQAPKSESKHTTVSKEDAFQLIFKALKDLKSRIASTHNVSKPAPKLNYTQNAKTKETLVSIINASNKVIANVSQEESKCNCKHDTEANKTALKAITNSLKDVIAQIIQQESKSKSEHFVGTKGEASKLKTDTANNLKSHAEQIPNVSQQEPKSKSERVARTNSEGVKSITNASEDITSTTANRIVLSVTTPPTVYNTQNGKTFIWKL